jgi:hypothetical protein
VVASQGLQAAAYEDQARTLLELDMAKDHRIVKVKYENEVWWIGVPSGDVHDEIYLPTCGVCRWVFRASAHWTNNMWKDHEARRLTDDEVVILALEGKLPRE